MSGEQQGLTLSTMIPNDMPPMKNLLSKRNHDSLQTNMFKVLDFVASRKITLWQCFHPTIVGDCLFQVVTSHCCCKLTHTTQGGFSHLFIPISLKVFRPFLQKMKLHIIRMNNTYHLLTESEVITGKSQTEALMYWPSDSKISTLRRRSEISL